MKKYIYLVLMLSGFSVNADDVLTVPVAVKINQADVKTSEKNKNLVKTGDEVEKENKLDKQAELRFIHFFNIDELVSLRAPGLALNYLKREQPDFNKKNPTEWLYWEQKRIALLKYMRRWQDVENRVSEQTTNLYNTKVSTGDRSWFLTEQIRSLVELKKYDTALARSRDLLWNASSLVSTKTFAAWRRLIIKVYLNQGKTKDAQLAMRRYLQDYGELQNEDGLSWLQLQAELLIQLQQYKEAISILSQIKTDEAQALILISKLNNESISPADVLDSVQIALATVDDNKELVVLYKYVALIAAVAGGEVDQAIRLFEALLSEQHLNLTDSLIQIGNVSIDADTLWGLYLKKGNEVANNKGLLKGNDEKWYNLASNLFQTEPLTAKSLFAVLSIQGSEVLHRELAMKQFVELVEVNDQPLELVNRLFTDSKYIPDMAYLPAVVRYRLIDFDLLHGKVKDAAALMKGLQQPPEDQPQFDWNLRRARVLILSGSFEQGAEVLHKIIKDEQLEPMQIAKYLQVVFDLQAVEKHKLSLALFDGLEKQVDDVHIIRELTFWRAESYHGLKQYDFAAYLFLKSSVSPDKIYDPWYHTATFRASESLMEAGLYEDARQRFLHLLRITENSARKAVIRQRLQTIQLKQSR